jgi:penicillin-binding protein 2
MPDTENNLAERSGSLVEAHKNYDPRIVFFYFMLAALMLALAVGLAYQQLRKVGEYADAERQQNQRRILFPGPRGNIEDRNGKVLVNNRARFSVRLLLDQLRAEFRSEQIRIRNNFRALDDKDVPTNTQLIKLARVSVIQRYLDQVNAILGRFEKVKADDLNKHFQRELLLPYTLIDDLEPAEYARLLERLPVNSPAQLYTLSTRHYPFGSAASHTLGYVGATEDVELEDFPGEDLKTFKMKGSMGRAGVEQQFDSTLQGEAGGAIFRVDPTGNRINPPLQQVFPKQGKKLTLSLDIEMQMAAEARLGEYDLAGTAVAMDVKTGEVLVLASKPDYDLRAFVPHISRQTYTDIESRGAWLNRVTQGTYMPGSSFKILVSIAGLRTGAIGPSSTNNCVGVYRVGNHVFPCHDRRAHGEIRLETAVEKSCNVFFYRYGLEMGPETIANEARRFHLDRPTGIELPHESRAMLIPDPTWKQRVHREVWTGGDTANMSIGQGGVTVTPLQMACFAASVARNEIWTQPTLVHDPYRPTQRQEPIGLTPQQRAVLLNGMELVTKAGGTAHILTDNKGLAPLGIRIGAKSGTAQKRTEKGTINFAWLIAFAPLENPEIALAIAIEGDTPGEETGGGRYASPVAHAILKTWLEKKNQPQPLRFKTE